jgi:hypothetical protein
MKNISMKILTLLVFFALAFTSCLNDLEDYMGGFTGIPATAEILNRPSASTGLTLIGFVDPTKKIDVLIKINISVANPLGTPTKVTMALDNALITAYNTAKSLTGLNAGIPVPDAALIFTSMDVTIDAGKTQGDFKFQVDPTKIVNAAALNIIPLKIGVVDNGVQVSGNFGTALVQILGRNKWDGIYTVTGTFTDYVNPPPIWSPFYPKTVHLITMSAYACSRFDAGQNTTGYIFDAGGGSLSYYGAWTPYFTFDGSDNITACTNSTAPAAPRNRRAFLFTGAGAINKYVAATKIMDVSFYMTQDDVSPVHRNDITEHYVYVGPRPGK